MCKAINCIESAVYIVIGVLILGHSNTESIRDVQFSPHQAHTFAAVSENGTVQVWDSRRSERCLQQFTAHSGPVFACDWHPDVPWLATASRDKTIKVRCQQDLISLLAYAIYLGKSQ